MDDTITRWSDHTQVEEVDDKLLGTGWRVSTTNNGFQFWDIGTIFPTERGAQMVAKAIELALKDTPLADEAAERIAAGYEIAGDTPS